jgi:hypothetical protein
MKRNFIARAAEEAQQVFGMTFYAERWHVPIVTPFVTLSDSSSWP